VRPAGIVFDLDGTLVDSRPDLAAAVNAVRASLALPPLAVPAITAMVGEGARVLLARALPGSIRGEAFEAAFASFLERYFECCLDHTHPYPGIAAAVAALAASYPLAVLTNKPERHSRKVLAGLGLLAPFRALIGGDTLPQRKPDPAGLLALAARWGTSAGRLLLVGDSAVDAATARAAGSGLALVEWGFAAVAEVAAPGDWCVTSPADLARRLLPAAPAASAG
jgi:phosphoglycolate phosphatase